MTLEQFRASLSADTPPPTSLTLRALWYAGKSDWKAAHDLLQYDDSADGSWVHAYLHRIEPDVPHAARWYLKANQPLATGDFETEWDQIATALLAKD